VSTNLIRTCYKDGPRKTRRRKIGNAGYKRTRQRILKLKNKKFKKVNKMYSGKTFEVETVKKKLIAVNSCKEKP
jgi:hypothetical protein